MLTLNTERLLLRDWRDEDIQPFYEMSSDPVVMEHFPFLWTHDLVIDFINKMRSQLIERQYTLWAAEEKATGSFIGFIGLNKPSWEAHFTPCIEIGWRLNAAVWGKGYATEGARAVLDYGFNQLNIKEILSFTIPENLPSRRVMEKLGMKRDMDGDFLHPKVDPNDRCAQHVLYRIHNECNVHSPTN